MNKEEWCCQSYTGHSIMRHVNYAKYILKHKWYVYRATRFMRISRWRGLVHDMSKLLPSEWFPYAKTFYNRDGSGRYDKTVDFNMAWLKHQHRNKHHWQYWLLRMDSGLEIPMKIPQTYVREMVADWMGAGRAITGEWEVAEWYEKNRCNIHLHPTTEDEVDAIISVAKHYKG